MEYPCYNRPLCECLLMDGLFSKLTFEFSILTLFVGCNKKQPLKANFYKKAKLRKQPEIKNDWELQSFFISGLRQRSRLDLV